MSYDARTHLFANNAQGRLLGDIDSSQTEIQLRAGEGAAFPSPTTGQIFKLSILKLSTGDVEIMNCTARDGDVLTVERAREGTAAASFPADSPVQHSITAETLNYLVALLEGSI